MEASLVTKTSGVHASGAEFIERISCRSAAPASATMRATDLLCTDIRVAVESGLVSNWTRPTSLTLANPRSASGRTSTTPWERGLVASSTASPLTTASQS